MRTIDLTSKHFMYQQRHGLTAALSRLLSVVEYNFIDSGYFDLHDNLQNMLNAEEAEQIVDFIGYKSGIDDMYLLIDELQLQVDIDLTPQTVLFIMLSPPVYIEDQLNTDSETATWLYTKLHLHFMHDDLLGFMKELLSEAGEQNIYAGRMIS